MFQHKPAGTAVHGGGGTGRGRRATAFGAVVALVGALVLGVPGTAVAAPTGDQLAWLVDASSRVPLQPDEIGRHLAPELVAAAGGTAGFNAILGQLGPFTAGPVLLDDGTSAQEVLTGPSGAFVTSITVGADGRLAGLRFSPYLPAPASWSEVDSALRTLAPRVSFAASRITATGCDSVHEVAAGTARPLGSVFKLYVLGALARAVAAHRLAWDQTLPVHDAWKSLPSGVLQDAPAGTALTLEQYADYMISISDNTAADHLIHEVGRDAVERQVALFGTRDAAADVPFLTTREMFTLKGWHYPVAADAYLAAPRPVRSALISLLDAVPRTDLAIWTRPERVDSIEWFASARDICRVYAGLWAQHDSHVDAALSINDAGIGLSRTAFPTVWFKGGSEPGVLSFTFLARARSGGLVTASVLLSDPDHPLNEAAVGPTALAVLRGAIQLAAG